ncbi:hypothetical protein T11_9257 [Trichinella zimbabwensis]|uniref:Uncharacterized protein n=1 Tax=Trichinella zimbabwensis TaxID=268475 RepID=A0A0V1I7U6_9BILA|nr:hypothetical protein T11_9257 [Trichinella zimbabwensis]
MCEYDFYGLWEIVNSVKDFHFNVTYENDVTVLSPEQFMHEITISTTGCILQYHRQCKVENQQHIDNQPHRDTFIAFIERFQIFLHKINQVKCFHQGAWKIANQKSCNPSQADDRSLAMIACK